METIIILLVISGINYFLNRTNGSEQEEEKPLKRPVPPEFQQPKEQPAEPTPPSIEDIEKKSRELFEQMKRRREQRLDERTGRTESTNDRVEPVLERPIVERPVMERPPRPERAERVDRNERHDRRVALQETEQFFDELKEEGIASYDDVWSTERKSLDQSDLLPKKETDLLKGVIFAEIMSPPKAKRRSS